MKTRHPVSLIFCLASILLVACQPEPPMDAMEEGNFVKVLKIKDFGFDDADAFTYGFDLAELLFFADRKLVFRAISISYMTKDPFGEDVEASGVIYHPLNRPSKGFIEMLPFSNLHKDDGASDKPEKAEALLAYMGYTVLLPDLLGFGVSKSMQHPYLMVENTGRVVYDFRRAAAEYLRKNMGYEVPSKTTLAGYSLGGFACLAVQKYYETHHANSIKVEHVYSGSGIYDISTALRTFVKSNFTDFPAIPLVVLTYNHFYKLDLDFSQIFKGELLQNYKVWFNGTLTGDELLQRLGTTISDYVHPDFFKPLDQQNDDFKKLQDCFAKNSLISGWTPKAPISFIAAEVDSYVGESVGLACHYFRQAGSRVTLQRVNASHVEVAIFFLIHMTFLAL